MSTGRSSAALLSLGRTDYGRALELQRELWRLRVADTIPDTLVLLEHDPVVTLGRSAKASNLLVPEPELARRGIALYRIERGGDVTFHGPGQLVGYPVFKLKAGLAGVRRFVEGIEAALVAALAELGVGAEVRPGVVGVWRAERKIASLGIAVGRRVAFHGFALNVSVDLDWFGLINPCGLSADRMTSVAREGGTTVESSVRAAVVFAFEREFGVVFQAKLPRILTSLTDRFRTSAIASTSDRV